MTVAAARRVLAGLAVLAAISGCAAERPAAGDNAYCARALDRFDTYDVLRQPAGAFSFRQMQLASIRQHRCITLTRYLVGLEAVQASLGPPATASGPAFPRAVAVHAGVLTNSDDVARATAFFAAQGYRSRAVGSQQLGTRVYVEARTLGDVERIVASAQRAGFVGPYPSRYVAF